VLALKATVKTKKNLVTTSIAFCRLLISRSIGSKFVMLMPDPGDDRVACAILDHDPGSIADGSQPPNII
jgi:hypothetical protein